MSLKSRLSLLLIPLLMVGLSPQMLAQKPTPPERNSQTANNPKPPKIQWPEWNLAAGLPWSSVVEIGSSTTKLNEDLDLMILISRELRGYAGPVNYRVVITDADDVRKLAARLFRGLVSRAPQPVSDEREPLPGANLDDLTKGIAALDQAIKAFADSPALKESHSVDARSMSSAESDLQRIINDSVQVRRIAEQLAPTTGDRKHKPIKSRLEENSLMQLSIDCDAWTIPDLLKRPAEPKDHITVEQGGIKISVRRYRLLEPVLAPADDCLTSEPSEDLVGKSPHFAVMARDYLLLEARGRVFAYQVTYLWAQRKEEGVELRSWARPLSFYFVDSTGEEDFALFRGSVRLGLVPEWVRDLPKKP